MGAPTDTHIDPASGNDGNDGSLANPYKTIQFALDNTTRDATNGDRFNVKVGSADVLSSKLVLTTYGSPSGGVPCIFQGYTTAVGDGGIGAIDGNGASVFNTSSKNGVCVINMVMSNVGNNPVFRAGADCFIADSEFHTCTTTGAALQLSTRSQVIDCYVHTFKGTGIICSNGTVAYCFLDKSETVDQNAVIKSSLQGTIHHNIVKLSGSGNKATGINLAGSGVFAFNNSIWSNAGDGIGLVVAVVNRCTAYNNLIEGFSASGGVGISTAATSVIEVFNNAVNDCETAYSLSHDQYNLFGDNETLSTTPFANTTLNDFTPEDIGNVRAGFTIRFPVPVLDPPLRGFSFGSKGAVQQASAVASSGGGRYRGLVPGGGLGAC